jgi:S1-C subfamily serine protease
MVSLKKAALALAAVAALSVVSAQQASAAQGVLGVYLNQSFSSVYISGVAPGTSAWNVGIQPGWRLVSVNGVPTNSVSQALYAKAYAPDNTPVPFIFEVPGGSVVLIYGEFSGNPAGPVYFYKASR